MAAVYPEMDNTVLGLEFYLLDTQGKVLAGTRNQLPAGLQDLSEEWGILKRMVKSPEEMQAELAGYSHRMNRYLLMGKAKSIDELVEAFAAVKTGDWTHPLNLQPSSGLAVVQEAYEHMTRSLQELMKKNEEEAKASVISEIRQLESQFNPHFLFNTLENIKFMVKLDSDAAMRMIKSLSKLLRYSINNTVRRVSLADDLAYVRGYVEIQQLRFSNRLDYRENVDPNSLTCEIPKLIFQPALENAVKYGADAKGRITISLEAELGEDMLQIHVRDRGRGMDAETFARLQALLDSEENDSVHMGVYNIHRRIRLMYGKPYGVQVKQREGGGTEVVLVLPIIRGEGKNAETGNRRR